MKSKTSERGKRVEAVTNECGKSRNKNDESEDAHHRDHIEYKLAGYGDRLRIALFVLVRAQV